MKFLFQLSRKYYMQWIYFHWKNFSWKQNINNFRELWRIHDINICIDKLDDGFILGEMEILVQNPSQVSSDQYLYIWHFCCCIFLIKEIFDGLTALVKMYDLSKYIILKLFNENPPMKTKPTIPIFEICISKANII